MESKKLKRPVMDGRRFRPKLHRSLSSVDDKKPTRYPIASILVVGLLAMTDFLAISVGDPLFCISLVLTLTSKARPVICSTGRTCDLYTASNIAMAGCCSGSDTQNCGWAKSCVNYDAYTKKSCDANCETDPFIWKCSDSATPYCVTWTYPDAGVADYACATINSPILTVLQTAEDDTSVYWKTLATLSGNDVTGWDEQASSDFSDTLSDFTPAATNTDASEPTTSVSSTSNGNTQTSRPAKKSTPIGVIVGAVVGGLVVLFLIGAALIFFCVKRRKSKALANNQSIIAAQQANRPESEFKPPVQQQYAPPVGVQSPPPQNGYFAGQDQKINYQHQVQDQGPVSPVLSNPSTPAPAYVQPYYAAPNAPPAPPEGAVQYPAREPTPGTYEVDTITSNQTPQAPQARPVQQSNVFEMGSGK